MKENKLPVTEELDFHYLLTLLPPLFNVPEFAWLPELFSIIGHERLVTLCKYAGGETITLPTVDQLQRSLDALQWFYNINIAHKRTIVELPEECKELYSKIVEVYNARAN